MESRAKIDELVEAESLGPLTLKGLLRPVPVFGITGLRSSA